MRKLIVLIAALAVVLAVVPVAVAGNGSQNGKGPGHEARNVKYSITGTVTAVDTEANTLTVKIRKANRRARAYRGEEVALNVTDATRLYQRTVERTRVTITLADFSVGDRISSVGKLDKSDKTAPVFTAKRITLRLPLCVDCNCAN